MVNQASHDQLKREQLTVQKKLEKQKVLAASFREHDARKDLEEALKKWEDERRKLCELRYNYWK